MIDEIKQSLTKTLPLIKELNNQIKDGNVEGDLLIKLSSMFKLSALELDKIIKKNKLKINGGVTNLKKHEEDED